MQSAMTMALVKTIKELCRVCYACVRECPAKAIRISTGQAEVISQRCIGCGNCVQVCSQNAKQVLSAAEAVETLLQTSPRPFRLAAMVAPSFPSEFAELTHTQLVGMIRALGFDAVHEVAFGADLVARAYADLLARSNGRHFIATNCPAIVAYVERYHPELVGALSPIVSPMIAMARVLRRAHRRSEAAGPAAAADLKVVFIGPCIAKKGEAMSENVPNDVDEALTFTELRGLFERRGLRPENVVPTDFDPPHGGAGSLFAICRGLLQAADIHEDLMAGEVVSAGGRVEFVEAIKEFKAGDLDAKLLEVLACSGCIMGPGVTNKAPLFSRRSRVSQYVRQRMAGFDHAAWERDIAACADVDLTRGYSPCDQRLAVPNTDELQRILARMGKTRPEDELNCGACGYDSCVEHAIAIHKGLAETEMCLPHTIEQLRTTVNQLVSTQEALMHSERLASMGQLAAGVAHEVNNPLGVVLMYAHMLLEECEKNSPLREDLTMIAAQADRCKKIVAGLLNFARENKVRRQRSDLREIVAQSLETVRVPPEVKVQVVHEGEDHFAELDADQVIQMLTNLLTNAVAAMPDGGTLTVRTGGDSARARFEVIDTGIGIPPENLKRIYEPFFTTKPIGKGTGLGLSVTYGIVKMHQGDIQVASNADPQAGPTGTTFTVTLPRRAAAA